VQYCRHAAADRQTDTQTRVTTIHFSWSSTHAKCNKLWMDSRGILAAVIRLSKHMTSAHITYTVCQKNVPPLVCYNFDIRERILIFFGIAITDKVSSQKALYCTTPENLCFCTTWQNRETKIAFFSLKCCISALPEFN